MAPIRRAAQRPDFASHPSDLELISTYLIPWVSTGERPWKFVHEADVYAATPQDLARAYAPATASDGQEELGSTSRGGGVIGTSPSATPPRVPRSEALRAAQLPRIPTVPVAQRPDFASHPSDQVLIKSYLTPRVASGQHPCQFTHDADVYTASPAALTRKYSPALASDGEKAWYFFTLLPAKSAHGQRGARPGPARRPGGTPSGGWTEEEIRQFFSFMTKEEGQRVRSIRSGWIMVEIGLDHGKEEGPSDELVLCKVYRSPRAGPVEPPAAAGRKRKSGDNYSGSAAPVLTLGPAPGARNSTAASTSSSGHKKRKTHSRNSGPVLRPARGVLKLTRPVTSGRKKNSSAERRTPCARCGMEPALSHRGTPDPADEEEDGSETDLDEDDPMTGESGAPHCHRAGESSVCGRTFYQFKI
uniref:NAC domain-containing protein 72 n=1 Tax=Aegilops tauschii TaxID=37682 RepID=N1R2V3_AEGTA